MPFLERERLERESERGSGALFRGRKTKKEIRSGK
jgi:hypothetical protein